MQRNKLAVALSLVTTAILSGCSGGSSGGGDGSPATSYYSVKAIDGYLRNATIWLDIDGDFEQDADDPSGATGEGGSYDLDVNGITNYESYPLVVQAIAGVTIDEDTITDGSPSGTAIDSAYLLSAPAGVENVTPLSTLVHIYSEQNLSGTSTDAEIEQAIADAVADVADLLGISEDDVLSDFIEGGAEGAAFAASNIVESNILPDTASELSEVIAESPDDSDTTRLVEVVSAKIREAIELVESGAMTYTDTDLDLDELDLNTDTDADGVPDELDAFPSDPTEWLDADADLVGDNSDNCLAVSNSSQTDSDADGIGDACDSTDDSFSGSYGETLNSIIARDYIKCGVQASTLEGFYEDTSSGIDAELCRMTALAVLGDADKVEFTGYYGSERASAITSSEVDVMYRNTTATTEREETWDAEFPATYFYDGPSLISNESGIQSLTELSNSIFLCDVQEENSEVSMGYWSLIEATEDVQIYLDYEGFSYTSVVAETLDDALVAFNEGSCNLLPVTYRSVLLTAISTGTLTGDYSILEEFVETDALSGVIPAGDDQWYSVVASVTQLLLLADENDVTSDNVTAEVVSTIFTDAGIDLSLLPVQPAYLAQIIETYGNYSEFYQRNLSLVPTGTNSVEGSLNSSAITLRLGSDDHTTDADGDGYPDYIDAFPANANEWLDSDGDGIGNNEDSDDDGDGTEDTSDDFPDDATETTDTDGDGVGDNADDFPDDATETTDTDGDGVGDNADDFPDDVSETMDDDVDGVGDNADNCPAHPNSSQTDSDNDGIGDVCDSSDDSSSDGLIWDTGSWNSNTWQ